MKNKFLILLIIPSILIGCEIDVPQQTHPIIDKIQLNPTAIKKISLYEIDGCEYIGHLDADSRNDYLTHKGNCKYCIERNRSKK